MEAITPAASSAPARELERDATDLIQMMSQTLNTALLYGIAHKVARSSLETSHTVLSMFIEFHGPIHFSLTEGLLLINGASTAGSPLATSFTARLTGLNLFSFTVAPGFTLDEFIALYTLLLTPAGQLDTTRNAADRLDQLGLEHIEAKAFSYRRVADGDTPPGAPASTGTINPAPAASTPAGEKPDLDNILAFLKDEHHADPERSAADIRHLAADTEKLAELILRSVEIRASMADLAEGESLTDLIVGCIQKAVHPILKDPATKTQKGRKQIKHSLLMLEKTLLDRLQKMAGDAAAQATGNMMEEIVEDLDLDALASKYMKDHRMAEKTRAKVTRLIERVADDPGQLGELKERLLDQGLTPAGWQQLSVKLTPPPDPGVSKGEGPGPGGSTNEIRALTLLLARLGETIEQPPAGAANTAVKNLVEETGRHLTALTAMTGKKIGTLETLLADSERGTILNRRELMKILAEITQEIMQPLTIINGTTSMIRSLKTGPLTDTQGELLSVISESGDRLAVLTNHLMRIVGTPEARTPDHAILNTAYAGAQKLR